MDAISYSYADKAHKRIKKFIAEPDSTSGVVTVPSVIAAGETVTIPAGRTAVLPNVKVDGTLKVDGTVFIPTGTTMSKVVDRVVSTDNAIVRFDGTTGSVQNSGVIISDTNVVSVENGTANQGIGVGLSTKKLVMSYDNTANKGIISCADWGTVQTPLSVNGYELTFNTGTYNTVERMRIANDGSVLIGGTNPAGAKLIVKTNDSGIEINPTYTNTLGTTNTSRILGYDRINNVRRPIEIDASVLTLVSGNGVGSAVFNSTGNLLIGQTTDDGLNKLQVNGNLKASRVTATDYVSKFGDIFHFNYYHAVIGGVNFVIDFTLNGDDSFDIEIARGSASASQFNKIVFTQMSGIGQYSVINNQSACTVNLISSTVNAYRYTLTVPTSSGYTGYSVFIKFRGSTINSFN